MLDVTESWRAGAIVGKWTEAGILLPDSLRCNSQRPAHPSHITNECLSGRLRSCGTSPCWLTVELFPFLARFLLPPIALGCWSLFLPPSFGLTPDIADQLPVTLDWPLPRLS